MSWPLSQDYNEAIQDPRNGFSDADLKTGEAVANALGIPLPRSGNFADVYEVRCPSGSRWAVKCFTREVAGLSERYSEIGKYLTLSKLPFMVDFKYLEQGIRVRGQWYPILKMQWVEGFVLNEFVRDNLDKKPILQALSQIWLRMARRLRESYIAHCDLQHGNVMFVPGSKAQSLAIKLIDYDGMCVPSLVGTRSGEIGHPAYQHPERLKTGAYDQEVDRFSLLLIATSLRCLAVGGRSLWQRYDNGDNLLFRQADLQSPGDSPLFQELFEIPDDQAQVMVKELFRACRGPLDKVPLLTDLFPEEKPASKSTVATTSTKQPAAGQGEDWDFNESESAPSTGRRPRTSGRMPKWIWAAGGVAAAVLLLGVGLAAGLMMRNGPAQNEETPVAQNKPEGKKLNPTPKAPPGEGTLVPKPDLPPPDPVKPPPPSNPAGQRPVLSAQPGRVFLLSPTGGSLAVSNKEDKTWQLVNPQTRELIREFVGHEEPIKALSFSFDGARAVSLGEGNVLRLWGLRTGIQIGSHKTEGAPIVHLSASIDGKFVATAALGTEVSLWNCETWTRIPYFNPRRMASCVACSPDTRFFVSGYDKGEKEQDEVLYTTSLGSDVKNCAFYGQGPPARVTALAVSRDGKHIVSGQSGEACLVSIWETETGKRVQQLPLNLPSGATLRQVAFSPDGENVLAVSEHHLRAWRVSSGQSIPIPAPEKEPDFVSGGFSADSKRLLFAGRIRDQVQFYSVPAVVPQEAAPVVVTPPLVRPRRFTNKVSAPDPQTLTDKRKHLQEVAYKNDYNKGKPKRTLPAKLFDDSRSEGDLAMRYAMVHEACDIAARAGDLSMAFRASAELASTFEIDLLDLKTRIVEQALPVLPSKLDYRLLAQKTLVLFDRALIDEDFERGERLLTAARAAAAKADTFTVLGKLVDHADKQFKVLAREYEAVKDAAKTLEKDPENAEANLALGRFRCFIRGDWERGLPLLVKGGDKALSEVAQKDAADPVEAAAQAAAGDAWVDYADKAAEKEEKAAGRQRAIYWYQTCLDDLDKKEQPRVKKRLADLKAKAPELGRPFHDVDHPNLKSSLKGGVPLLHVPPFQTVATRRLYHTPIDIRVTALLPKNHIRITFLNGGEVAIDADKNVAKVRVFRPFSADPDERGSPAGDSTIRMTAGSLNEIRIRVTNDGWKVWVNGQSVSSQGGSGRRVPSFAPTPVRVWSEDGEIELKSIVVKPVR